MVCHYAETPPALYHLPAMLANILIRLHHGPYFPCEPLHRNGCSHQGMHYELADCFISTYVQDLFLSEMALEDTGGKQAQSLQSCGITLLSRPRLSTLIQTVDFDLTILL